MKDLRKIIVTLLIVALVGSAIWAFGQSFFVVAQQPLAPGVQMVKTFDLDFLVSVTAFSIAVITFFGVIQLNRSPSDQALLVDSERLRTAMACSLVITYLYIVCFTTFVKSAAETGGVTQAFMQSFSNVIGITIAFYFGASAATQIFARKSEPPERESP